MACNVPKATPADARRRAGSAPQDVLSISRRAARAVLGVVASEYKRQYSRLPGSRAARIWSLSGPPESAVEGVTWVRCGAGRARSLAEFDPGSLLKHTKSGGSRIFAPIRKTF
eukprot:2294842-Prymnesium_polylepis.1